MASAQLLVRFVAFLVDATLIASVAFLLQPLFFGRFGLPFGALVDPSVAGKVVAFLYFATVITLGGIYYVAAEVSSLQGTFGKVLLGLGLTDLDEQPISIGQACGRYAIRWVGILPTAAGVVLASLQQEPSMAVMVPFFMIGSFLFVAIYFPIFLQEMHQGLHDLATRCVVREKETVPQSRLIGALFMASAASVAFPAMIASSGGLSSTKSKGSLPLLVGVVDVEEAFHRCVLRFRTPQISTPELCRDLLSTCSENPAGGSCKGLVQSYLR
jgi:uncharacterized RDD family membrane protein YckC